MNVKKELKSIFKHSAGFGFGTLSVGIFFTIFSVLGFKLSDFDFLYISSFFVLAVCHLSYFGFLLFKASQKFFEDDKKIKKLNRKFVDTYEVIHRWALLFSGIIWTIYWLLNALLKLSSPTGYAWFVFFIMLAFTVWYSFGLAKVLRKQQKRKILLEEKHC